MANRISRGLWYFRVFMMCASLVSVLLAIEYLNKSKISLEPFTGAQAESTKSADSGISVKVLREMPSLPAKDASPAKPIDKNQAPH